jgi:hypothetical protein
MNRASQVEGRGRKLVKIRNSDEDKDNAETPKALSCASGRYEDWVAAF